MSMEDPVKTIQDAFEELKKRDDFSPEDIEKVRDVMARFGVTPKTNN